MTLPFGDWDERTRALALEEVTLGLSLDEREELLARLGSGDLGQVEVPAAALNLAGLGKLDTPPAALLRRLEVEALAHLGHAGSAAKTPLHAPRSQARWSKSLALSGWLVAALLFVSFLLQRNAQPSQDSETRREVLVANAADLVRAEWVRAADPLAGKLSGDVVWSRARQEGYLRFRNLAPNDPTRHQYQLWIFDRSRDEWEAKPVDGGVFDVGPDQEVVVRIDAKLEVRQAALFALTLEPPGGVVISAREHLLATAAP